MVQTVKHNTKQRKVKQIKQKNKIKIKHKALKHIITQDNIVQHKTKRKEKKINRLKTKTKTNK